MTHKKISAPILSVILVVTLVLLLAVATAGFLYVRGLLLQKADETAQVTTESANSNQHINTLKEEQAALRANANVEKKVQDMLATGLQYTYQDQVVDALKAIATTSNVSITGITFSSDAPTGAATGTPAANSPAAPAAIPGNVTLKEVNVAIASPVAYDDLLRFLRNIEQNTMSMKVARVSITGTSKTAGGHVLVNCDSLTIGVYMR